MNPEWILAVTTVVIAVASLATFILNLSARNQMLQAKNQMLELVSGLEARIEGRSDQRYALKQVCDERHDQTEKAIERLARAGA